MTPPRPRPPRHRPRRPRLRRALPALCALAALGSLPACLSAPEAPPPPPEARGPGADPRAVLAERAAGPPTAGHRALEPLVGPWQVVVYDAAGGQPLARGVATLDWRLGGRVLQWETALEVDGRPAESIGLLGFDPRANLYQLAWSSGLSSTTSLAVGRGELEGFGIRLVAEAVDAAGAVTRARSVLRLVDARRFEIVQEVERAPGAWAPVTRTLYARPAAGAEDEPPGALDVLGLDG